MDDRARAIIALTRSEKLGEVIAYAFWAMNERRFGMELATNGGLEMTLVGYKHALCELQEAHPGEFVNFKPEEPMRMVEWAVRCEVTGYSIPAAVAVTRRADRLSAAAGCSGPCEARVPAVSGGPRGQLVGPRASKSGFRQSQAVWVVDQGCDEVVWAVPCARFRLVARQLSHACNCSNVCHSRFAKRGVNV